MNKLVWKKTLRNAQYVDGRLGFLFVIYSFTFLSVGLFPLLSENLTSQGVLFLCHAVAMFCPSGLLGHMITQQSCSVWPF